MFNATGFLTNAGVLLAAIVAGGLGSAVRLLISHWNGRLPWGILVGNTLASVIVSVATGPSMHPPAATILSLGLAGGLSTFSTWAAQTVHFYRQGQSLKGNLNLLLNLGLPAIGAITGIILSPLLLK
ncbi:MAG: hypothetical protein RJA35_722 [Actinomycetota bacterium]